MDSDVRESGGASYACEKCANNQGIDAQVDEFPKHDNGE
jgi:hypothetical protein